MARLLVTVRCCCCRLYAVRWNTFGSVPPLPGLLTVSLTEDAASLLPRAAPPGLSMAALASKAARSASPPLYEDPPSYEVAVMMQLGIDRGHLNV